MAKLLVSSDENYYYGLAKGSASSTPNSIIFSMDNLLNNRWSLIVQAEISSDLFFLSYDDTSIYYIHFANGCTLVKQPTSGSSIEFSKTLPHKTNYCRMMTMSKDSNYLYSSTLNGSWILIYQFDVNQIAINYGIQYFVSLNLFDLKSFTSDTVTNGILGTFYVNRDGNLDMGVF